MKKIVGIFICVLFFICILAPISLSENKGKNIFQKSTISNKNFLINDDFFDKIILNLMNHGHFPSISVCIVKDDKIIWSQGYGYFDIENKKPVNENTVYNIASITKTITATALMQLWEEGLLNLDEDVNKYLPFGLRNPNFPDTPITFRMLLSHSSSLRNTNLYFLWKAYYEGPPFPGYPYPWLQDSLLKGGKKYSSSIWDDNYKPGEYSYYANINFDIIGYLVEIISGEPFYEYCENNIFIPLNMMNTSFNMNNFNEDQLAIPYSWDSNSEIYTQLGNYMIINYPVGGLYSSLDDLSHFLIAHMNGGSYSGNQILNRETIEEMHKIQPPGNQAGYYYGLGWLSKGNSWWLSIPNAPKMFSKVKYSGHSGDMFGIHTQMYMQNSKDLGVLFLINSNRNNKEAWNSAEILLEILFIKANL